jgi:hypothetical protein
MKEEKNAFQCMAKINSVIFQSLLLYLIKLPQRRVYCQNMHFAYPDRKFLFLIKVFFLEVLPLFTTSNAYAQRKSKPSINNPNSLDLEKAQLEPRKDNSNKAPLSAGPFNNINFGGTVDMRLYLPQSHGPSYADLGAANFDLHVVELFLSTNAGDHISLLLEQLLVHEQDGRYGGPRPWFCLCCFLGNSLRSPPTRHSNSGRFRSHFGIDTHLDSATHILRNPIYKTIGIFTDKGIELSGFYKSVDWSLSVMNGIDSVLNNVNSNSGNVVDVRSAQAANSKPVVARIGMELTNDLNLGISAFSGVTHPVLSQYGFSMSNMLFNAKMDEGKLVYKNRYATDVTFKISSKIKLSGEYCTGIDRDEGQSFHTWKCFYAN